MTFIGLAVVTITFEHLDLTAQTAAQNVDTSAIAILQLLVLGDLGVDLVLLGLQIVDHLPRQIAARLRLVAQGEQASDLLQVESQTLEPLDDLQTPQLVFTIAPKAAIGPLHGLDEAEFLIIADGARGDAGSLCQVADLHGRGGGRQVTYLSCI